jgi:hypothetical protein
LPQVEARAASVKPFRRVFSYFVGIRVAAKRKFAESDEVRKEESDVRCFRFLGDGHVFLLVRRLRNDLGNLLWLLIRASDEAELRYA